MKRNFWGEIKEILNSLNDDWSKEINQAIKHWEIGKLSNEELLNKILELREKYGLGTTKKRAR